MSNDRGSNRAPNTCKRLTHPGTYSARRDSIAWIASAAHCSGDCSTALPSNCAASPLLWVISVAMPPGENTVSETLSPLSSSFWMLSRNICSMLLIFERSAAMVLQ